MPIYLVIKYFSRCFIVINYISKNKNLFNEKAYRSLFKKVHNAV